MSGKWEYRLPNEWSNGLHTFTEHVHGANNAQQTYRAVSGNIKMLVRTLGQKSCRARSPQTGWSAIWPKPATGIEIDKCGKPLTPGDLPRRRWSGDTSQLRVQRWRCCSRASMTSHSHDQEAGANQDQYHRQSKNHCRATSPLKSRPTALDGSNRASFPSYTVCLQE